jgi:hypothetical protein
MKILNKIFYLGVFSILLLASIKYPFWVLGGALAGGLSVGDLYSTATGEVRVVI